MRLIIDASLKQVNLVWSTVSVLKADAAASYPGNHGHVLLAIALQGPHTVLDWCRFHFLYGSRIEGGHHTSTSPYPMPFTCITLLWIRGPRHYFFLHPLPYSPGNHKLLQSFQHQTWNPDFFYITFSQMKIYFTETGNTWIYSFLSVPLDIPILHLILAFQHLATINRYDVKTWRSLQGTPVRWNSELSGAEEPSLNSQGLIRLCKPNLVPLMKHPRWFSRLSHLCFAGTSGTCSVTLHCGAQATLGPSSYSPEPGCHLSPHWHVPH